MALLHYYSIKNKFMKLLILLSFLILSSNVNSQDLKDYYYENKSSNLSNDSVLKEGSDVILTRDEEILNQKLLRLQKEFINASGKEFPPSHYFYRYRNMIDTSESYQLLKKMPKGAMLHIHSSAMGPIHWLINTASYYPNCYMYTLNDNDKIPYGTLYFYKPGTEPDGWVALEKLRKDNPDFDRQLHSLLTFDIMDDRNPFIWSEFEKIFTRHGGLVQYYPVFVQYIKNSFDTLIADGMQHIEIRTSLGGVYDIDGKNYSKQEVLNIYNAVADTIRMTDPQFSFKIIYAGWRGGTRDYVMSSLNQAIDLRSDNPDKLVGFDLVGEEDLGHTTEYFKDEFFKADSIALERGTNIPFYFHDGESTIPSDLNLYDAVALRTKRIGHGVNLFRFPSLQKNIKEKGISLEVCPLSNQILGYVENLRMHPASEYINKGIPITISTDDPQIFDYNGMTYDFWSIFMAWELDLRQLKKLVLNSIEYSAMSEEEKTNAYNYLNQKWSEWVIQSINN
ncbi:MAG TPA: hypothetical protein DIS94_00295 [Bacteroidetes bacterium]|nr:hypothetical protein [Bacteroidota bacterium]